MAEPIQLSEPQQDYIPLSTQDPANLPIQNPDVIQTRAEKAEYGMNGVFPYAMIRDKIMQGDEDYLRQDAALKVDQSKLVDANWILQKNPSAVDIVNKYRKQNPQTVFEDKYAEQYMNAFYNDPESGTFTSALKNDPDGTAAVLGVGKQLLGWRETIHKRLVDASEKQEQSGLGSKVWNFLKDVSGYTSLYTLRGNVPGTFLAGGLTGSNLEAQRQKLLTIPIGPERNKEFNRIMDYLIEVNPNAAIQFADFMENPSSMKIASDNAFNLIDAGAVADVGVSAVRGIAKGLSTSIWRREVRRMTDEAMSKAPIADGDTDAPVAAVATSATGSPVRAAKYRMAKELSDQLQGAEDPTRIMHSGIISMFKPSASMATETVDNVGAESLNRMRESWPIVGRKIANLASNMNRVIRTGDTLADQAIVDKAAEEIEGRYPGLAGNTMNILPVKHDVISNTFSADQILGRNDGSFFSSLEEALTFADFNGIPVNNMHGVPSAGAPLTGAAVRFVKMPKGPAPAGRSLGEVLTERIAQNDLSRKTVGEMDRLLKAVPGEEVLTDKVKIGDKEYTRYRPISNAGAYSQGKGFYIAITRPINETAPFIRDSIMQTEKSMKSNKGWMNRLGVGWIRTPSETLNVQDMTNRQLAIYAPAMWKQAVADVLKPAMDAKKQNSFVNRMFGKDSRFELMLKDTQAMQKDFESVSDLNDYYMRRWNELPSEVEVKGYQALLQGRKIDWVSRNLAVYRNNQRLGGELHTINVKGKDVSFNGVIHNHLPDSDYQVMVIDGDKFSTKRLSQLTGTKAGKEQAEGITKGEWKLIRLIAPEHKPLADHTDKLINWVLTRNVKSRPLEFQQLPERQGGHMEYPYDWMVKHPNMDVDRSGGLPGVPEGHVRFYHGGENPTSGGGRWVSEDLNYAKGYGKAHYVDIPESELTNVNKAFDDTGTSQRATYVHHETTEAQAKRMKPVSESNSIYTYLGDTTAMAVDSRAMGQRVVDTLHEVQRLLKAGDVDAAERAGAKIPVPWDGPQGLKQYFLPLAEGKPPRFSMDQPFYVVPRGKTIADLPNHFESYNTATSKFRDISKPGGSLNRQFQVEFTGERDAYDVMSLHDEGTSFKPLFAYRPADLVDPFTSINRSISRIIDSTYMDDVKIASIEGWLQRAKGLLDAKERDIKENPFATFHTTPLKKGVDDLLRQQLEAERYQIKAFSGIPSKLDTWLQALSQSMADSIHGSEGLKRAGLIASKWTYDKAITVPSFMRSVTYHTAIGLFALPQFLVQLNTYVTIAGIAGPGRATQGAASALLMSYARHPWANEQTIAKLGKIAENFGYRPGEFEEMRQAMINTGFHLVGRETNMTMSSGHMYPEKVFTSAVGKVLDLGQFFFVEGEKASRYGAWATAWKEFRELHPNGRLTMADTNAILNRADDLAGNMTKASKSLLQSGFGAFPTQFLGYQMRLFEQFTGKRLTPAQKMRLFGTYAAIYGVPVASGLGALPLTDMIRQYGLTHGYVEGENAVADTAMNGIPAMMLKAATGEMFNVGERFGAPGFDQWNQVLSGSASFWSIFPGATGNTMTQLLKAKDPFLNVWGSWMNGENVFKVTGDDLLQPLKASAAVNSATRAYQAYNSMQWLSRNESIMAKNVSPAMIGLMTLTGLQPLEADKTRLYHAAQEDQKNYEKQAEDGYLLEHGRAVRALNQSVPDYSSASTHFRNADSYLIRFAYPELKKSELTARAWNASKESMPARERWNFWLSGHQTPAGEERKRQEIFGRIEQQLGTMK